MRAYEVAMSSGSSAGKLSLDDFPSGQVNADALPEIEVHTIIAENKPGERWIMDLGNSEFLIRERWRWSSPAVDPKRQGFDVAINDWSDNVPWGAPNVANAYRPLPHRIDAFASPDMQEKEIVDLVSSIMRQKCKEIKSAENTTESSDYDLLLKQISDFQTTVSSQLQSEIQIIADAMTKMICDVFPDYEVKLDPKPDTNIEKTYTPFKENPDMFMGPRGGYLSRISSQGSGARRTLLWNALRFLSEKKADSERPHVLLLDEPEICLHPSAIREARNVLYSLPGTSHWQVMVTTHSPVFIDLANDNTTIVRVERNHSNEISSTTLYRPQQAKLDKKDKENLKLLNVCDPYLHEFFFGGRVIIVEGDTEFTAFSYLRQLYPDQYKDIHIIRARGKAIIPSIVKILNQFSSCYSVLHDSDLPVLQNGNVNPMWTVNENILNSVANNPRFEEINLIASITNFEIALFKQAVCKDKPYNAIVVMKDDESKLLSVKKLFDALLSSKQSGATLPEGCFRWESMDSLRSFTGA